MLFMGGYCDGAGSSVDAWEQVVLMVWWPVCGPHGGRCCRLERGGVVGGLFARGRGDV